MRAPRVLLRAMPLIAVGAVVAASAWAVVGSRAAPDRSGATRASVVLAFPVEGGLLFADIRSHGQRRTELPGGYLTVPSPDARLVAYEGSPSPRIEIRDARSGRRLGHFAIHSGGSLVWSPDGRRVAVRDYDRIVVIDVHRKTVAPIAVGERPIHGLAWSPDGRVVAFDRNDRIVGVDVATKEATVLARGNNPGDPAWSPDGKWIAYIDDGRSGNDALFVVSAAAPGKPRLLAARANGASPFPLGDMMLPQRPAWSPDSRKIAFGSGYPSTIHVVGLDGAAPRPLTRRPGDVNASDPVWSPDGRKIAFVQSQIVRTAGGARIHVIDADGRHDQLVLASDPDAVPSFPEIVWPRDLTGLPRAAPGRDIVTVVPDRQLLLDAPATQLAVDGDRAATISRNRVWTWSRRTGKSSSRAIACDTSLYDVALAGIRDAVVCYEELNTMGYSAVSVGVNGRSVDRGLSVPRWDLAQEDDAADLHVTGAGPLLVALRITGVPRSELWRIAPAPQVRLRTFGDLSKLFNVDEGRALVQVRDGLLQVVDGTGAVLASLKVQALQAVLRGRRVIVLSGTTLTVRDLAGRVLLRRPVAAGSHLQDARGDVAVLARGNSLHLLRLSDGRDKMLRLPGQTGPAWARLAPQGLFYAHGRTGAKAGVVGFVTAAKLQRLLAS